MDAARLIDDARRMAGVVAACTRPASGNVALDSVAGVLGRYLRDDDHRIARLRTIG